MNLTLPEVGGAPEPFKLSVPQEMIDDLRARLRNVRWADRELVEGDADGVPLDAARELVDHWLNRHDWRAFEQRVNALPQYRVNIDGLGIHFLHIRSRHENALPMLVSHGWPGSFVEFLKVVGPLTDPEAHGGDSRDAFHLVIPSLPGFGLSDKPAEPGWGIPRIVAAWVELMKLLGYDRWVAQGGDIGSIVTHGLAKFPPPGLAAAHVNWPLVVPNAPSPDTGPEELAAFGSIGHFMQDGAAYLQLQSTRPQTLSYALADSPVAQASWIYEKFCTWTDREVGPRGGLTLDEILDNISLYWFTGTGGSSARLYKEMASSAGLSAGVIDLPMAASIFPREIVYVAPRSWAEGLWPNLIHWNQVEKGGHFAAFEQPGIFVDELRTAFRSLR